MSSYKKLLGSIATETPIVKIDLKSAVGKLNEIGCENLVVLLGVLQPEEAIDAAPEWISVRDGLPEVEQDVFVTCEICPREKKYTCSAMYIPERTIDRDDSSYVWDFETCEYDDEKDIYWVLEGWYERIHNWDDYSAVPISDFVTHWMPLPEAPKEDVE